MKKIVYSFFALLLLLVTSCKKDFFDINDNPNQPTEESITPNLLLPRSLYRVSERMAISYDYAALWTGYWARSGTYGPSIEQESYSITTSFQATQWSGWFDILRDVNLMEKLSKTSGSNFYQGAAKTIKAIGFMYLVDQYNNVPYSKAFDFQGNILPPYDKGADIYADLLLQLDSASVLFKGVKSGDLSDAQLASDIMFGGDPVQWRKLVNSQRLKLLIHESQVVSNATVTDVMAKITADGAGFLGAGESANVNPGFAAADEQQNPFYNQYKVSGLGALDNYNRANNYTLNKFRNSGDIRYQYVYSKARTPLNGNIYYGYNYGEAIPNSAPKAANSSDVAGPGLAKSPTQDQWLFTSVESLFLQAEAIQRGWLAGNAKNVFESAVNESFTWLGVPEPAASDYIAAANPLVNWDASTDKTKLIVMQKYLSLAGINNFEAYVDYRRLGVPTDLPLSLATARAGKQIPLRLQYPQAEYNFNSANVGAEGAIDPQTSAIFWDK